MPGCAKSSGHANLGSIEAKNLDSQTLSVLHKEDLVGTEKNGKPDNGDEREEQQRMHETCGKQLFEHDKVQAMDQGAQQSTQKVCSSYEGEEDYIRCASGGYGGVSHEAIDRDGLSNAGEEAPKKQFVIVKEREHAREKRLASQGRPKEGTRLKVMSRGGKFYSCSVVKTRFLAVKVHYIGWGEQFDEWVQFPSSKVKMDQ